MILYSLIFSVMSNADNHSQCTSCIKNAKWCGQWGCPNQPELTEGRSCKMCQASNQCIENLTWCGEVHCINYEKLLDNPHPTTNSFIGKACSPWQENDGTGGRYIEGLNRNDFTEEEQQKIIDDYNAQAEAQGRNLSEEVLVDALLKFIPTTST